MDPKLIAVIVGIIGALLGVYFREHLQAKASKRKAFSILRANILLFMDKVNENERLEKFVIAGFALDERKKKSLKTGDDKSYRELLTQVESIENHVESEEIISDESVRSMISEVKKLSQKEIDIVLDEIDKLREDIEHGTYILGNNDINVLDSDTIKRVLTVKRTINDILISLKLLLAGAHERDDIEMNYVKSQILSSVKSVVFACRHILPLLQECKRHS